MGLFDQFSKKEKVPGRPAQPKAAAPPPPPKEGKSAKTVLNKRSHFRYIIEEMPAGDIGTVVEMSKSGLKLRKKNAADITDPLLEIRTPIKALKAEIVWQDSLYAGLKFKDDFDSGSFIKQSLKKIRQKDELAPAQPLSYSDIARYKQYDILTTLTGLMTELESENTDINRLKQYIVDLHETHDKIIADKKKTEAAAKDEAQSPGTEADAAAKEQREQELPDLKEELLRESLGETGSSDITGPDIDCIVARLGLDAVKRISGAFVKKNMPRFEIALPGFKQYQVFNTLKTVVFTRLAPSFGYKNEAGEGSSLLSLEDTGLKIFMQNSKLDLSGFYHSPSRLYSEASRVFERMLFGVDLLQVNNTYFGKAVGSFKRILDGYVLGHLTLNPYYKPPKTMKLSLTKEKLAYGFVVYLTMLAVKYILERDNESGSVLLSRLRGRGMDERKAMALVSECIAETNSVLSEMGIRSSIQNIPSPSPSFKIESYLPKDSRFDYIIGAFRDFGAPDVQRMVLRYDDETYAHFILDKLLTVNFSGLHSKTLCIIPCENIAEEELYLEDLANFDLAVFKNIDRLPASQQKAFIRIWNNFEGKIVATLSSPALIDCQNRDLYALFRDCSVDFPSYLDNPGVYCKMVDHTVQQAKEFLNRKDADAKRYLGEMRSMDSIKVSELAPLLEP